MLLKVYSINTVVSEIQKYLLGVGPYINQYSILVDIGSIYLISIGFFSKPLFEPKSKKQNYNS